MIILGIETSCDETGIGILKIRNSIFENLIKKKNKLSLKEKESLLKDLKIKILANQVASQIKIHRKYGGVVPSLAGREHKKNLPIVFESALEKAKIKEEDIGEISFIYGPGLAPALIQGKNFTKEIAYKLSKSIWPINHLVAHLYSPLLKNKSGWQKIIFPVFPALGLVISGGHTILVIMKNIFEWQILGQTKDDAIGEAFDKTARLLDLPYPGGPEIEKLAKNGNPDKFNLPRPMIYQKNYDFSYAGLKTAVLYLVQELKENKKFNETIKKDISASFQKSAFEVLIFKINRAIEEFKIKSILVGGGVASNCYFRKEIKKLPVKSFLVERPLATDNGLICAFSAIFSIVKGEKPIRPEELDISANLSL